MATARLGSIGIKYKKCKSESESHLIHFEQMTGLDQPITGPTRLDSTIDLVYTNSDCVHTAGILEFSLSHHNLVFVTRKKIKDRAWWFRCEMRSSL